MKPMKQGLKPKTSTFDVAKMVRAKPDQLRNWVKSGVFGNVVFGRTVTWDWEPIDVECAHVASRLSVLGGRIAIMRAVSDHLRDRRLDVAPDTFLVVSAEGLLNDVGVAHYTVCRRDRVGLHLDGAAWVIELVPYYLLLERMTEGD